MGDNRPPDYQREIMLSILIPSIPSRKKELLTLVAELRKQINHIRNVHFTLGKIELCIDDSRTFLNGGLSIGKKREKLVQRAQGKYLCFLDDDEGISPSYCESLLRLTYMGEDVCTFRNISTFDTYWCIVDMSIKFPNEQARSSDIVRRQPWHICPVRSEFAKRIPFKDSNYGEDWEWFGEVLKFCQTEAKTNEVIHRYNHSDKKSEANKAHEKSGG